MTDILYESLRREVASGRSLVILGAGISAAATSNAPTSTWPGLIRDGIEYASATNQALPPDWAAAVEISLDLGIESGYLLGILNAAQMVSEALGGEDSGEFKAWLRQSIGELRPADTSLPLAIAKLGLPVATTNYDSVFEIATGRRAITWRSPNEVQRALRSEDDAVVHLHGHWQDSESIIFGTVSYARVIGDTHAQALQQAVSALSSIVFIGVGDGASDPNFLKLRNWLRTFASATEMRHYRLCRDDEAQRLTAEHAGERVVAVPYGSEFRDLVPFLERLAIDAAASAPAVGMIPPSVAKSRASASLVERVRANSVLAPHMVDIDNRSVLDILIPPILLPVTHEQFVSTRDENGDATLVRIDVEDDAASEGCLVIAGEEATGVSSAMHWLVARRAELGDSTPVAIDFRNLKKGHLPLDHAVRKELLSAGALPAPDAPIPDCAVAIDNVATRPANVFQRLLNEIQTFSDFTVLGCRQGTEVQVCQRLQDAGIDYRLRYVGRLNHRDTSRLIALVDAEQAPDLARTILRIANIEGLSRTPFTLGLLTSVALAGESMVSTTSEVSLVDAYASLLLGRGDPHDDARFELDAIERADILASLAEVFVANSAGSLSESAVLDHLATYFDLVGWEEDPMAVLANLIGRRVLVVRSGHVRFAQNAFLYLFAAKQAIADRTFRDLLYAQPVVFGPVIRYYAGLTRNDPEVVAVMEALLDDLAHSFSAPRPGGLFAEHSRLGTAVTVDELVSELREPEPRTLDGEEGKDRAYDDWLDHLPDGDQDPDPFPSETESDSPFANRVLSSLTLVSSVLRDSELLKDVALKERVLEKCLRAWGCGIDAIGADPFYLEFSTDLAHKVADISGVMDPPKREDFVHKFVRDVPLVAGAAALATTLSSRKLLRVLDNLFGDSAFIDDPRSAVMGALLAFVIGADGWPKYSQQVDARHANLVAVREPLHRIELMAYRHQHLTADDERTLRLLLADRMARNVAAANNAERKAAVDRVSQRLQRIRLTSSPYRLAEGENVLLQGADSDGEGKPAGGSQGLSEDLEVPVSAPPMPRT